MKKRELAQKSKLGMNLDIILHRDSFWSSLRKNKLLYVIWIITVLLLTCCALIFLLCLINPIQGTANLSRSIRSTNKNYSDVLIPVFIAGIIAVNGIAITTFVFLKTALDNRKEQNNWSVSSINKFQECMSNLLRGISILTILYIFINLIAYSASYIWGYELSWFITLSVITFVVYSALSTTFCITCFFYPKRMLQVANGVSISIIDEMKNIAYGRFGYEEVKSAKAKSAPEYSASVEQYLKCLTNFGTTKSLFFKAEALMQPYEYMYQSNEKGGAEYKCDGIDSFRRKPDYDNERKAEIEHNELTRFNKYYANLEDRIYVDYNMNIYNLLIEFYKNEYFLELLNNEVKPKKVLVSNSDERDSSVITFHVLLFVVSVLFRELACTTISKIDIHDFPLLFADLYHTRIVDSKLNDVEIQNSILTRTILENCEFNRAGFLNSVFNRAVIKNCSMAYSLFAPTDYEERNLRVCEPLIKESIFQYVNLSDAKFRNISIRNSKFTHSIFTGTIFEISKLVETDFSASNLLGVEFYKTDIDQCSFVGTSLENIIIMPKYIDWENRITVKEKEDALVNSISEREDSLDQNNANIIRSCDFSQANMTRCILGYVIFDACLFTETNMGGIRIIKTQMKGAILRRASLDDATLRYVNLKNSLMNDAILYHSHLSDVDFTCSYLTGLSASKIAMNTCTLDQCCLNQADFTSSEITKCEFNNSSLNSCDFTDAIVISSSFIAIIAEKMQLTSATFSSCSFNRSTLNEILIRGRAKISDCRFVFATLEQSSVQDSEFITCDFHFADFSGSLLTNLSFKECKFIETINFTSCRLRKVKIVVNHITKELIRNIHKSDELLNVVISLERNRGLQFRRVYRFQSSIKW